MVALDPAVLLVEAQLKGGGEEGYLETEKRDVTGLVEGEARRGQPWSLCGAADACQGVAVLEWCAVQRVRQELRRAEGGQDEVGFRRRSELSERGMRLRPGASGWARRFRGCGL